jgi:hypothetical protein
MPGSLSFSRGAAQILGPLVIAIETWRRWHQFGEIRMWPAIFDDYLVGGFLLYAARVARPTNQSRGRRNRAPAWGVATGMMYGSFFAQLERLAERDPSGLPAWPVVIAKGIGLLVCLVGLVAALKGAGETDRGQAWR